MSLTIHIAQPTEPACYGPKATPEQIKICAANCLALAEAYAQNNWPAAIITTGLEDHALTASRASYAAQDGEECPEISAAIEEFVSRHWFEEDMWTADFDPERYMERHAVPLAAECVYCNVLIPASDVAAVPALDDDDEWKRLAEQHAARCEWIETRAHRLEESK